MNERRQIGPNGTSPPFPLEAEEMRLRGGSRRSDDRTVTLTPSITGREGQSEGEEEGAGKVLMLPTYQYGS